MADSPTLKDVAEPHSCKHCQRVLLKKPGRLSSMFLLSKSSGHFVFRLPHTKQEARQASIDNCPLFQTILRDDLRGRPIPKAWLLRSLIPFTSTFWFMHNMVEIDDETTTPALSLREYLKTLQQPWRRYCHRVAAVSAVFQDKPFYFIFRKDGKPSSFADGGRYDNYGIDLSLSYLFPGAAQEITSIEAPDSDISSEWSFEMAGRWLQDCISSHPLCQFKSSRFVPKRLVQVSAPNKLIETQGGRSRTWCALSYVWGGDQPLKTTKKTLEELKRALPDNLPQTLKDAIYVSRKLSIEYIWIDCLCIVQDDEEDLRQQLADMPLIYQRALVTISASSSQSVQQGFLQDRGYWYDRRGDDSPNSRGMEPLKLKYRSSTSKQNIGTVLLNDFYPSNPPQPVKSRAWTFQERRLSPRLLAYNTDRLRWRCRTCELYDGYQSADGSLSGDTCEPAPSRMPCLLFDSLPDWYCDIVMEYTTGNLTHPEDKIVAISAIANIYNTNPFDVYLAGLWKRSIRRGLCWRVRNPRRSPPMYRAPSWSWVAVDGEVIYRRPTKLSRVLDQNEEQEFEDIESSSSFEFDELSYSIQHEAISAADILSVSVTQEPANATFGAILAGVIQISGITCTGTWYYNSNVLILDGMLDGHRFQTYPDVILAEDQGWSRQKAAYKTVSLLFYGPNFESQPRGREGMVLEKCGPDEYRRIGWFDCDHRDPEGISFEHVKKAKQRRRQCESLLYGFAKQPITIT